MGHSFEVSHLQHNALRRRQVQNQLADLLANQILVSVDYRKAPENKFPAAADDAYAATQWVMEHAQELNGTAEKVAVAGESAGGNLATVTCLMARDKKGKMPIFQLLVYPIANFDPKFPPIRTAQMAPY
ncbi:MAG: alpha/beta hydrolase [Acidobacteriota bacterium]|nr:alpha/beta hydrolase [Acidobacteriota bacterium]